MPDVAKDFQHRMLEIISLAVIDSCGKNCWLSQKDILADKLTKLKPSKPEDKTAGFIAYEGTNNNRVKMKIGRFLVKKLSLNSDFLKEENVQDIANKMSELLLQGIEIRIDTGKQITANYKKHVGGSSCMTGERCDCTKLYESNPARFSQLVMVQNNDSARAILHKLDNGKFLLDRVYCTCSHLLGKMLEYARSQGWYYRDKYGYVNDKAGKQLKSKDGDFETLIVSDLKYKNGELPYIDTLCAYNIIGKKLTIQHQQAGEYKGVLQSVRGHLENVEVCVNCGNYIDDDTVWHDDETWCESCYDENFAECLDCGDAMKIDNLIYVDCYDNYVCPDCIGSYHKCDDCDDYVRKEDAQDIGDGNLVCPNCLDDYRRCANCDEYFKIKNMVSVNNGAKYVCEDCSNNTELYAKCNDCDACYDVNLYSNGKCEDCEKK